MVTKLFYSETLFLRGLDETAARKDKLAAERILQLSLIKNVARPGLATLFSKIGDRLRFNFLNLTEIIDKTLFFL